MSKTHTASEALPTIEGYLRRGAKLRAFLSGGGLRVVRVSDTKGSLIGYGEHPHIEDALTHTADDLCAGGRPYREVYGGKYPCYLTGASTPSTPLDAHVRSGGKVRAYFRGGWFFVVLEGYEHAPIPDDIHKRAISGETFKWSSPRGFLYEFSPMRFCSGEPGYSIHTLYAPPLRDSSFYHVEQVGMGETLADAIEEALKAHPEEVEVRACA